MNSYLEKKNLTKRCIKCECMKSIYEFYIHKPTNKLRSTCKRCQIEASIVWNKEHPKRAKAAYERWRQKHLEECRKRSAKWTKAHPERRKEIKVKWRRLNPEYHKKWESEHPEKVKVLRDKTHKKKRSTIRGQLDEGMGDMFRKALHKNKNGRHWETLVGYTLDDLRVHLESMFADDMNWTEFMKGKIHIDHVVPKSHFCYEKPEDPEFKICWGLNNLQPLWDYDNLAKRAKMLEEWLAEKHQTTTLRIV